jgi:hypothetical protein
VTLKDLRERTKRACHEARQVYISPGKRRFEGLNMRQAWEETASTLEAFIVAGADATKVIPSPLLQFYREGEIYYHAKKHGMASAMMLKLQRI